MWCADHIYAIPNPELIDAIKAHPIVGKGLFIVNELSDYPWPRPEHLHSLPPEGLAIVREICAPGNYAWKWHGKDAISWHGFAAPCNCEIISPKLVLASALAITDDESETILPPLPFLRFCKYLSTTSGTTVAYYSHFMWGGDTEIEYAWIFGVRDRALYYLDDQYSFEYAHGAPSQKRQGSVLQAVLAEYDIVLSSGFFALHRSFDWNRYRIQ